VQANETVLVDASLSNDPDGSIVEYSFDWGDGSTPTKASSSNATHVYAANGTYIVSVTAEDNRGAKGAPATAPVIVGSPAGDAKDPDKPDIPPKTTDQPGTGKTKGLPDVTPVGLLLVLALVAARHRRK
jgi:PKD repeat protein